MRATRPVSIGGITFDALIDYKEGYESDVPSYPTEEGFEISDTIITRPMRLNLTLYLTNTPVSWSRHGNVNDRLARLRTLYFRKIPVTVITSRRTYTNMAIVSFADEGKVGQGTSREMQIALQEVRIVRARQTNIPAHFGRSQPTANAGAASTTRSNTGAATSSNEGTSGNRASVLHSVSQAAGIPRMTAP